MEGFLTVWYFLHLSFLFVSAILKLGYTLESLVESLKGLSSQATAREVEATIVLKHCCFNAA